MMMMIVNAPAPAPAWCEVMCGLTALIIVIYALATSRSTCEVFKMSYGCSYIAMLMFLLVLVSQRRTVHSFSPRPFSIFKHPSLAGKVTEAASSTALSFPSSTLLSSSSRLMMSDEVALNDSGSSTRTKPFTALWRAAPEPARNAVKGTYTYTCKYIFLHMHYMGVFIPIAHVFIPLRSADYSRYGSFPQSRLISRIQES